MELFILLTIDLLNERRGPFFAFEAPPTPSLKEFTFQLFKILHFVSTKGTWKSNGKESKARVISHHLFKFCCHGSTLYFFSIHSIRYINCKISWALTVKTNNLFFLYLSSFTLTKRNPQVVPKMSFTCREQGKDDV